MKTFIYSCKVEGYIELEIEAETKEEAEKLAKDDAKDFINLDYYSISGVTVKEVTEDD